MGKGKKKYYAVARGHNPGIYDNWYGTDGAEAQVSGFPKALFKGFSSLREAKKWLIQFDDTKPYAGSENKHPQLAITQGAKRDNALINTKPHTGSGRKHSKKAVTRGAKGDNASLRADKVIIYTDGACLKNPGPGGYGVILIWGKHTKEFSGGFRLTTNNRMELMACIVGLRLLKRKCSVTIYTDSKYVVNGIKKGWAKRWRANGWMRNPIEEAKNSDLWAKLLDLCDKHSVEFEWVKGHAGHPENERCDQLAVQSASQNDLPLDTAFKIA